MSRKNRYQQKIWVYEKRRDEIRKEYGFRNHPKMATVRNITKKICSWRREIKRIEVKMNALKKNDDLIKSFMDISVRDIKVWQNEEGKIARNIFYKYSIEHGISSPYISEYIGLKNNSRASIQRLNFTRSFKKHKANKEIYKRFLQFIKNNPSS